MATLALLATLIANTDSIEGYCTYYADGVMGQVADNRGMSLDHFQTGAALNSPEHLNRTVWIEHEGQIALARVVDCAQPGADYDKREAQGYIAEVDYATALLWDTTQGPFECELHFELPEMERVAW